jgi:hypothetical protein
MSHVLPAGGRETDAHGVADRALRSASRSRVGLGQELTAIAREILRDAQIGRGLLDPLDGEVAPYGT